MPITAVTREYLLAIHALMAEGTPVLGARLAERLKVTPPTVHQTLERLKRDGLVAAEARRGIVLTPAGQAVTEAAVRERHLSERWLVEMLGLDWAEARAAARAMAGALSPRLAERLAATLGHPASPAAVPSANPATASTATIWPLDRAEVGAEVVLERIAEEGEHADDLLRYLEEQGLRLGARLRVAAVAPWAHTITLRHGEAEIVLGTRVAGSLWVRRLTADEVARTLAPEATECPDEDGYIAEVAAVVAACPAGHQAGDRFVFGQRTPCGMCGEAFLAVYQRVAELRARAATERAPSAEVACPEHGNVTFRLRLAGTPGATTRP